MAQENATTALEEEIARLLGEQALREGAAVTLAAALGLPAPPRRIECYDISHTQGTETVGSMVVFIEGRPKPGEYRRFKLRTITGPDDFASLQEVIRRRFLRARAEEAEHAAIGDAEAHPPAKFAARPDLMIIDGGKGQLSSVVEEMCALGVEGIPVVGLAKEEEHLFRPGESDPIILPAGSPALHLVQHIRDEAHRFAITYHRELRGKQVRRSALDEVDGVGPQRKKALLKRFGSVSAIRRATVEELASVPGITPALAERVLSVLHGRENE
jgi:excinuclease ABC subunit C